MVSERPGHTRAQAADAADDQVDGHAGLRGPVEGVDDGHVVESVDLDHDATVGAGLGLFVDAARRPGRGSRPVR